jgi:hypothetical protein
MTDTGETIAPDRASGLYRKRPVTVEARQLIDDLASHASIAAWIEAGSGHAEIPFAEPCLYIETLEGRMRAGIGDWVIKGVKGEFYPCKDDIFEATYEPADAAPAPVVIVFDPRECGLPWLEELATAVREQSGGRVVVTEVDAAMSDAMIAVAAREVSTDEALAIWRDQ